MSDEYIAMPQVLEGHEHFREQFSWGTRGVDGGEEVTRVLLKDMSDSHLFNILCTQQHITDNIRFIIATELYWRLRNGRET